MPKWSHYLDELDLDAEVTRPFEKIKKGNKRVEESARPTKKKEKPHDHLPPKV